YREYTRRRLARLYARASEPRSTARRPIASSNHTRPAPVNGSEPGVVVVLVLDGEVPPPLGPPLVGVPATGVVVTTGVPWTLVETMTVALVGSQVNVTLMALSDSWNVVFAMAKVAVPPPHANVMSGTLNVVLMSLAAPVLSSTTI